MEAIEGCKPANQGVKLVIDHENLECEDTIKYLGAVIHKNLTWNEHIESLIAKVNQRIGLLNRIKHLLLLDARVALLLRSERSERAAT